MNRPINLKRIERVIANRQGSELKLMRNWICCVDGCEIVGLNNWINWNIRSDEHGYNKENRNRAVKERVVQYDDCSRIGGLGVEKQESRADREWDRKLSFRSQVHEDFRFDRP